jgi:hypothetical protein
MAIIKIAYTVKAKLINTDINHPTTTTKPEAAWGIVK